MNKISDTFRRGLAKHISIQTYRDTESLHSKNNVFLMRGVENLNPLNLDTQIFLDHNTFSYLPDSAVGIAGYRLDDRGVGVCVKNFLFSTLSRPVLGPTLQWVLGAVWRGAKRQECEADHSPPISPQVKKMWIYTSTLPYAFMA
jgi:hypothetical protein